MSLPDFIDPALKYLKHELDIHEVEAAIILGSGLGDFVNRIQVEQKVAYSDIPAFPDTTVAGHDGSLIKGSLSGKPIIAFSGRFHHYEGHAFERSVIPVYVAYGLGAKRLIISNAAGGINENFHVGDLMVINDVMRLNGPIAPRGHYRYGYRHYDAADTTHQVAAELGIPMQRGTYMYAKGPNYETHAEVRAFRIMGADAVGMSTAPELYEASRLGLKSTAISLISNMAAGVTPGKLSHEEVKKAGELRKDDFARLVEALVERL